VNEETIKQNTPYPNLGHMNAKHPQPVKYFTKKKKKGEEEKKPALKPSSVECECE